MLSKIVSAVKDSVNAIKCEHFMNREKSSECVPSPFIYSIKLFLKLGTALLIGPAENCPVFSWCDLIHKHFGFTCRFQNNFVCHSPDMMSPWYSNLESY